MSTVRCANNDDRTITLLRANNFGLVFLMYALLADVFYRSSILKQESWDLVVLLGLTGIMILAHRAWHKVLVLNRNSVIVMVVGMIVASVISFILAFWKLI